jgi:hypothetical protein
MVATASWDGQVRLWEAASGRGFEAALPSGKSDANHPEAVADSITEFWALLKKLEERGQLPAEIPALEIGVGSGARATAWMDGFKALDEQKGTGYYAKLQFILGDYSATTLDRAVTALARHAGHVSAAPLNALNPFKTLSAYRFKVMYVHLTNVYDNLPFDDVVRRDGRLYIVEVRAYLGGAAIDRLWERQVDVPPIGDFVPGYAVDGWYGILAPANTPLARRETLSAAFRAALADPEIKERLSLLYLEVAHAGPKEAAQEIAQFQKDPKLIPIPAPAAPPDGPPIGDDEETWLP